VIVPLQVTRARINGVMAAQIAQQVAAVGPRRVATAPSVKEHGPEDFGPPERQELEHDLEAIVAVDTHPEQALTDRLDFRDFAAAPGRATGRGHGVTRTSQLGPAAQMPALVLQQSAPQWPRQGGRHHLRP
jgi:hypothetical protein